MLYSLEGGACPCCGNHSPRTVVAPRKQKAPTIISDPYMEDGVIVLAWRDVHGKLEAAVLRMRGDDDENEPE